MKYAVPMSGDSVAMHFGHCEQFALVDVDEEKKQILKKEFASSPGHEPDFLPRWLTEKVSPWSLLKAWAPGLRISFRETISESSSVPWKKTLKKQF